MSIAGQMMVWSRLMSLPMTCRSAGHQCAKAPGSSGEAGARDVVDERVEPDVDGAGRGIPACRRRRWADEPSGSIGNGMPQWRSRG